MMGAMRPKDFGNERIKIVVFNAGLNFEIVSRYLEFGKFSYAEIIRSDGLLLILRKPLPKCIFLLKILCFLINYKKLLGAGFLYLAALKKKFFMILTKTIFS